MRKDTTNMAKKILLALMITIAVVLAICVIIFLIFSLPWLILAFHAWTAPDPEEPTVKYGEFPFELIYEINGEEVIARGSITIEHKGIICNEVGDKFNGWNVDYIKAEDSNEFEVIDRGIVLYDGPMDGYDSVLVSLFLGSSEHYMGIDSPGLSDYYSKNEFKAGDIVQYHTGKPKVLSEEELKEKFGIVVKEKHLSDPIG